MLTVISAFFLVVGVLMIVLGIEGLGRDWYGSDGEGSIPMFIFGGLSLLAFIGTMIGVLCMLAEINTAPKYDDQIAIVKEVNEELEKQICASVESYLKHEETVYEKVDIQTAIGLFSAYPYLKSDILVQSLIETYQANAQEIKDLRIMKTELRKFKYLVYFGG